MHLWHAIKAFLLDGPLKFHRYTSETLEHFFKESKYDFWNRSQY